MDRNNKEPGYIIKVRPNENPDGTFLRKDHTTGEVIMELDPSDRSDLVNNMGQFISYMDTNCHATRLGCISCGDEVYISDMDESDEYSCPSCQGKLVNLDSDLEI